MEEVTAASLRPRRLLGLCLYCGRQIYSHKRLACLEHRDLLLLDPFVNRAHLHLTERERIRAAAK